MGFFFLTIMNNIYDIIIVGAGPAGLATAIEAQKAKLKYLVIDKGSVADSIRRFQRDMFFFSIPELLEIGGVPFVVPTMRPTSRDCVNYYRRVTEHYQLNCQFFERIDSIHRHGAEFTLTGGLNTYRAKAVVIATGYYDIPNPLCVRGEDLPSVSHYYTDPLPYYRQHILIVGGHNSAVEAALDLWRHGAHVTVVHRGAELTSGVKYWILLDFENRVRSDAIAVHFNTSVLEFQPGRTILQHKNEKRWETQTDYVFVLIGYLPDTAFLSSAGVNVHPQTLEPSYNPDTMETNVPNLFIAGGMVGGRFNNKIFIENGRQHGPKIIAALQRGIS
jgi:thioredoxin reductase (NADPH)